MAVNPSVLNTVYLCLGSNIEPRRHLAFAVNKIKSDFSSTKISSVYATPAVGFEGDDFLNLAVELKTQVSLAELLAYTDELEQQAGRVRVKRGNFDSRTLDVDVVLYGNLVGMHEGREWPSEDLTEYGHILMPLAEIAADMREPLSGQSFKQLWNRFGSKREFEASVQRSELSF